MDVRNEWQEQITALLAQVYQKINAAPSIGLVVVSYMLGLLSRALPQQLSQPLQCGHLSRLTLSQRLRNLWNQLSPCFPESLQQRWRVANLPQYSTFMGNRPGWNKLEWSFQKRKKLEKELSTLLTDTKDFSSSDIVFGLKYLWSNLMESAQL